MDVDIPSDQWDSEGLSDDNGYDEFGRLKRSSNFDAHTIVEAGYQSSTGDSSDSEHYEANQFIDDEAVLSSINRSNRRSAARKGKNIRRGPRKPVEPSVEFKDLHSAATLAFIDTDYDRAIVLVKQAIQINPEMFVAHSLLSEIFLAQGHKSKALAALFSGAHTRPKDPAVWLKVAKMISEHAGDDKTAALQDMVYCYSRVIEIEPKNYGMRFERASLYRQLNHNGRAIQEYEKLLKDVPHNTPALRQLAEAYIDLNDVERAKTLYDESISYYSSLPLENATDFDWSDVNIYVELFGYQKDFWGGLRALRSLSRWLLGRKDETEWDLLWEDDREWDAEDHPRRIDTRWFTPCKYPLELYGLGLPLELRVKLGIYRLKMGVEFRDEALTHFMWLQPEETGPGSKLYDYGDLFREAADALKDAGFHADALLFYYPLQYTQEFADTSLFMAMAECYMASHDDAATESCLLTVAEYDPMNIEARAKLAKFYERCNMMDQALKYVTEAIELGRQESIPIRKRRGNPSSRIEHLVKEFRSLESGVTDQGIGPENLLLSEYGGIGSLYSTGQAGLPNSTERGFNNKVTPSSEHVRYLYQKLLEFQPSMRAGGEEETEDWLDIADALLRNFRSNRLFFPLQKQEVFTGYSRISQSNPEGLKGADIMDEIYEMAGRIQAATGTAELDPELIPTDYHGIAFDAWLDIFLEYSLVLAGQGSAEEAFDSLSAAAHANVWYYSKPSTRQIYVCWFSEYFFGLLTYMSIKFNTSVACAIRLQDEEVLATVARWFMKEYQFVTDTYRLFATLSRLCGDPRKSLFHSSPSMKFMLRQVKAIDYTIPEDNSTPKADRPLPTFFAERASLSTKDEFGNPMAAEEMDVALLVLYGHILYAGNSFTNALNYFFRAYALDPDNPAVLLSIALSYIHHSLKRQSDNRHYLIMQGLSFMQEYQKIRSLSSVPQERQEVEFNFARIWYMLGLAHLAIEGFERCLSLSEEVQAENTKQKLLRKHDRDNGIHVYGEDYTREAAYALQCLYTFGGNTEMATKVTEKWLVL
ncbi:transcription factor TFIIIC subunit tfc4 [Ophidiomyces ophidiicola]|uniref:transcription factor TFIIIC subunit tfc4 n=1 Tax=Ophidiomyces ophidiicola TaxID=1387563 RepID=UPI0020C20D1A|nr:transcription factor TFIIIC subunit tfc4 [Ophidiomyces ophidiicola]KAI1942976.1 transcription factor TFIIIC subunit tfc4 [Ophidiomyces ophidiicola]KAI2045361.1 transcription factor TFIIIC subunit tfc4 [Ophidiomyces ophidiicola]